MGQGYSMTALSAATVTIDVPELLDLAPEKTLVSARFMKSIRARSQNGYVFVKAVQKPYTTFNVRQYVKQITEERNVLATIPNALGFQRVIEVSNAGFLVRQYMFSSVYDRLSTRPFLEDIERKWLAFQLLCAVRDCHARKIHHGDIKLENCLVTSWNWLYLTDFSSAFKPTVLPEDNPADFFFYFDTSSRRICYIAPERFTQSGYDEAPSELNWAMDMFSVGCTIAELFLEAPIFTLSQIFKYRSGDYSPEHTHLDKIEDAEVRAMIMNMIDLDPESRYSAEQHLSFYKGTVFPEYFYSFLHQYMEDLTDLAADHQPISLETSTLIESDYKIERVYQDFDKISYFLNYSSDGEDGLRTAQPKSPLNRTAAARSTAASTSDHDGTLLFLTLVSSGLRSTVKASARLKACDLLVAFAERLPDEAKLDRILPYLAGLLSDRSDIVKVAALHAVTTILDTVQVVSPINAFLFPEYIFPKLRPFLGGPQNQASPLVRAAYASCLASLALSSARMLDMVQAIRADGRMPALPDTQWAPDSSYYGLYDVARAELVPYFEEATTTLVTDQDTSVRRALLGSVARLCIFFGSSKSSDLILSHLNTYLNDKDWMLRCSFFEALVGVALYVGSSSLEHFILPMMVGSLTDQECFVVEKVFRSLSRMAALGLFQKSTTWELISIASRFLVHPSVWVREAAVQLTVQGAKYLTPADRVCIVMPLLQPFLRATLVDITEEQILDQLKSPLSRSVFDAAVLWASRKDTSLFWTAARRDGVLSLSDPESSASPSGFAKKLPTRIAPSQRDKDDQTALETLRNLGMTQDDEIKLLALREYILRVATGRQDDANTDKFLLMNNVMPLSQINVTPQNIFFDQRDPVREVKAKPNVKERNGVIIGRHTLADALLDASTTIDDQSSRRPSHVRTGSNAPTPPSRPVDIQTARNEAVRSNATSLERPDIKIDTVEDNKERRSSMASARLAPSRTDRRSAHRLRHSNSALHLINRTDTVKADAETSTTAENAFGQLDGQKNKASSTEAPSTAMLAVHTGDKLRSKSPLSRESSFTTTYEANHSYAGSDPYVLRMLEHHFTENFPTDLFDFGQQRPSIDTVSPIRRVNDPAQSSTANDANGELGFRDSPWAPSGQLLTQFSEHTAAINRVVAASDHAFFVTASDDGTCKIWDTTRLEKNITPRSRHTHRHAQGSKVKSLCFVENTHTFVSGADDGSIHAVRVEHRFVEGGESTRYGRPQLVRDYQITRAKDDAREPKLDGEGQAEHAVWLHHYRTTTSQSVLLAATNRSRILMIDMKTMDVLYAMENPTYHGAPTTFCVDRRHHWLLLGTTHGILDLWDLRFRLRLRAFGVGGVGLGKRIDRLLVHPTKGHGRWVMVSSGGEISIWDIEKLVCREVLRPSSFVMDDRGSGKGYEAWMPDEEAGERILEKFAQDVQINDAQLEPNLRRQLSTPPAGQPGSTLTTPPIADTGDRNSKGPALPISALCTMSDYLANPSQPDNPNKTSIVFSAGADRTIRYWNLPHIEQSFIVSGPQINTVGEDNKIKVRYESSWPTSMSLSGLVMLVEERLGVRGENSSNSNDDSAKSTPTRKRGTAQRTESSNSSSATTTPRKATTAATTATAATNKAPRSSIISTAQQQLLRTHLDGITDLAVLKKPYGMVVSVNRSGGVYIFH